MVIALWAACTGRGPTPNTIDGVQVVAVRAEPAQPAPTGSLGLEVWVADAQRRGSDVLLWTCTPADGECLEARPPGSDGLPFPLWAKVLHTTVDDPSAEATVAWPLFQAAAGIEGGIVPVWAAACTPGVCPIMDQIAANPAPGSEAWEAAARALAQPETWVTEAPPGSASVAVKLVPLRSELGTETTGTSVFNVNPSLSAVATDPDSLVHVFTATDDNGDDLEARAFVTAGGADRAWSDDGALTVSWFPPADTRVEQDRFVVVTDGRGGTAVWTNRDPPASACDAPEVAGYAQGGAPLPPGGQVELSPYPYGTVGVYAAYLTLEVELEDAPRDVDLAVTIQTPAGNVVASQYGQAQLVEYDPVACTGRVTVALAVLGGSDLDLVCRMGGRTISVITTVSVPPPYTTYSYVSFAPPPEVSVFTQEHVIALPPDLPCSL